MVELDLLAPLTDEVLARDVCFSSFMGEGVVPVLWATATSNTSGSGCSITLGPGMGKGQPPHNGHIV